MREPLSQDERVGALLNNVISGAKWAAAVAAVVCVLAVGVWVYVHIVGR